VVAACSSKRAEPEPAPAPAVRKEPAPPKEPVAGTVPRSPPPATPYQIHWSNVDIVDNCFYFSGPDGRDDKLVGEVRVETVELEGSALRIRIGATVFEGTYVAGALDLVRDSQHEFGGAWKVHETLRGRQVEGEMRATYSYEECELDTGMCPGRCTMSADVSIRR